MTDNADKDEWDEIEGLRAATDNPVFAELANSEEDVYSLADGKPLHDEA